MQKISFTRKIKLALAFATIILCHIPGVLLLGAFLPLQRELTALPGVPRPTGPGMFGSHTHQVKKIPNPHWKEGVIYLYQPDGVKKPPLILFLHGIGAIDPQKHQTTIDFLTSRGFAVLHTSYSEVKALFSPQVARELLLKGILTGIKHWEDQVDLKKLGIYGHSFGAGSAPAISQALVKRGMGTERLSLFLLAAYYFEGFEKGDTPSLIKGMPEHTEVFLGVFEDDKMNDHRLSIDFYERLDLEDKYYALIRTIHQQNKRIVAHHDSLLTGEDGAISPLLSEAILPLVDFFFMKEGLGKSMMERSSQISTEDNQKASAVVFLENPVAVRPEWYYVNFWRHALNPQNLSTQDWWITKHGRTLYTYSKKTFFELVALFKEDFGRKANLRLDHLHKQGSIQNAPLLGKDKALLSY